MMEITGICRINGPTFLKRREPRTEFVGDVTYSGTVAGQWKPLHWYSSDRNEPANVGEESTI